MLFSSLLLLALGASANAPAADSARADADLRDVALHHASEVKHCYETQGLKLNPTLAGTIEVSLTVLPTGRVDSVAVTSSQLAGVGKREVESCVTMVARNWRFDRGPYGVERIVYPFDLRPDTPIRDVARRT
jgi:outer membrane biosynthesis protein TonB